MLSDLEQRPTGVPSIVTFRDSGFRSREAYKAFERRKFRVSRKPDAYGYHQKLGFTCGPACLMSAMAHLNPLYQPSFLEETLIWREANTIFMGEGHPGTNAFGLGLSALRRRRKASVYGKNMESMFEFLNSTPFELEAQRLTSESDRRAFIRQGGSVFDKENVTVDLLRSLVDRGDQILVLVWLEEGSSSVRSCRSDLEPRWVLLKGVEQSEPSVFDPFDWVAEGITPPDFSDWENLLAAIMKGNSKSSAIVSVR